MSKKEGKTLSEIFEKFRLEDGTVLFQMVRCGTSHGATDKKSASISIVVPKEISNNKNRNLGEVNKYVGIIMFIPKEKVEEFMRE